MNPFEELEQAIFGSLKPNVRPCDFYSEILMSKTFHDSLVAAGSSTLDKVVNYTKVYGIPVSIHQSGENLILKKKNEINN